MFNNFRFFFITNIFLAKPSLVGQNTVTDGVAHWLNDFFKLKGDERISKIKVHRLARWVIDQYEEHGRLTAISDQELEAKTEELLPGYWEKYKTD